MHFRVGMLIREGKHRGQNRDCRMPVLVDTIEFVLVAFLFGSKEFESLKINPE
jgi:hypothetical protein